MANRNTKNKLQAWGIALQNRDGSLELVYASTGREATRLTKRNVYPGADYKTVRINGTFETYSK